MSRNRSDVGYINPITRLFHILQDMPSDLFVLIFKKLSTENELWLLKYTILHQFQVGPEIKLDLWSHNSERHKIFFGPHTFFLP